MASLSPRRRGTLTVLVGFALLLNPFVVSHFDIGDPDRYQYEAVEVEFHQNGTADVPRDIARIKGLACVGWTAPSRSCVLEQAVYTNGGIQYDGPPSRSIGSQYRYVFIDGEGFFRPVSDGLEGGTQRYSLRHVPMDEALETHSMDYEYTSRVIQYTIRAHNYTARDPIDGTDQLVHRNGRYYVVTSPGGGAYTDDDGGRTDLVVVGQWVFGIAGARLIMEGQRARVEAEA